MTNILKRAAVLSFLFIALAVCGGCSKSPVVQGYAFVTNADGVTQLRINADGSLTPIRKHPISAGGGAGTIAVDPSGKFAYVANSGGVFGFTIDALGNVTLMSTLTVSTGVGSGSITVDPSGKYAYVTNNDGVSQFVIGADGNLTPMSIPTVSAGANPGSITVDPSRRYAYVVNRGGRAGGRSSISQYSIGADGSLSPMSTPTVTTGTNAIAITVFQSGKYVYVVTIDGVSQFTVGADGSLAPMAPPVVAAGEDPRSIAVVKRQ